MDDSVKKQSLQNQLKDTNEYIMLALFYGQIGDHENKKHSHRTIVVESGRNQSYLNETLRSKVQLNQTVLN